MVRPDIAFQLTNDLILPTHMVHSFLFFPILPSAAPGVKSGKPSDSENFLFPFALKNIDT